MRNTGTHDEVIFAFFNKDKGPSKGHNVFWDDDYLYSYGRHFWLAYRHKSGFYLVNGDYYSSSTRKHQSYTQQNAPDNSLTVSAGALELSNIDIETVEIIDQEHDQQKNFYANITSNERESFSPAEVKRIVKAQAEEFYKNMPTGATMFTKRFDLPGDDYISIPSAWHRPGGVLLRSPGYTRNGWKWIETEGKSVRDSHRIRQRFFIMGMDDGQYFISQLPRKCTTIPEAYDALKPQEVIDAEKRMHEVRRQGEWFFVPVDVHRGHVRHLYRKMTPKFDLTDASGNDGSAHIATRGARLKDLKLKIGDLPPRTLLVSGHIRHSTHEHPMLKLSMATHPYIFAAYRNTAKQSFSMGGNVD